MCQLGSDVNQTDTNGKSPLAYATESGALDVLEILLQFGAMPCANDTNGKTPLHWVAGLKGNNLNHLKIAEHLIEMTNNLDQRDNDGCTPLHLAAMANNSDVSMITSYILIFWPDFFPKLLTGGTRNDPT